MKPNPSKVLVVDDDQTTLQTVSKWLKDSGFQVKQAANGREALSTFDSEHPDFLLTDWRMPQMDGLQLCQAVRQRELPHYVYIVFFTAMSGSKEAVEALKVGADDFVTKPVDREELLARMRAGSRVLEMERRLTQMARTDSLTGLMNQGTFYELLRKEWARSLRARHSLSCVMIDLDFFKRINDLHGHPAGDAVLKAAALLFEESCRTSDTASRYGGEEFCVMLPETPEHGAEIWAERVRERLSELVVAAGGKELQVTGSIGVAERRDDTQTPEELIDLADQALQCAKQSGRNCVVCYESLDSTNDVDPQRPNKLSNFFEGITALHVMTPAVVCLREDQTVGSVAEFFLRSRINSSPVVDAEGKLSGIVSERDLMAAMVTLACWQRPVRELMKPNVICYAESTPIRTIYEFLCRVSVRRVVIIEDGRPTGTISRGSLLRWFRSVVLTSGRMDETGAPSGTWNLDPSQSTERLAETAVEP